MAWTLNLANQGMEDTGHRHLLVSVLMTSRACKGCTGKQSYCTGKIEALHLSGGEGADLRHPTATRDLGNS